MDHQSSAIKNGVIQDWEAMEELWRHGFHKLGVATEDETWKVGQGQGRRPGQVSVSEEPFTLSLRFVQRRIQDFPEGRQPTIWPIFQDNYKQVFQKLHNKKVLLREHKRHAARWVASARYADLSNGGEGGNPSSPGGGYPYHPDLAGGYPHPPFRPGPGVPPIHPWDLAWGVPHPRSVRGVPGVPPHHPDLGWGNPPSRPGMESPPPIQTWDEVPPSVQTWDEVPPVQMCDGVPPPPPSWGVDWQTNWKQNLPPSFGWEQ